MSEKIGDCRFAETIEILIDYFVVKKTCKFKDQNTQECRSDDAIADLNK